MDKYLRQVTFPMDYIITIILVSIISIVVTSFVPVFIRYVIWRNPVSNKWVAVIMTIPSFFMGGLLGEVLSRGWHGIFWPAAGAAIISYEILRAGIHTCVPEQSVGDDGNDYFIELLKSAIKENRFDIISDNDLIKIYERAMFVDALKNNRDIELTQAIKTLLDEIKKRELPLAETSD